MNSNDTHRRGVVRWTFAALTWLGLHELSVLLSLVALSGGVWAFLELADEVVERETESIDEALLLSLRNPADASDPLGPGWVEEMGRDFTALGGTGVLTLITLAALGYLLLANRNFDFSGCFEIPIPGFLPIRKIEQLQQRRVHFLAFPFALLRTSDRLTNKE